MNRPRRLYGIALNFIIFALLAFNASCAHTPPIKSDNSIASLEKVKIGGVDQWLLIRGKDKSNPVLLFVHGGPGSPEMPWAHHFSGGLEDHFVVVNWDQRRSGKSYSGTPKESLKIDQFVSDAHELTRLLLDRFGAEKIFIVGHSWGSVLSVLTVRKYPDLYYAYVGIGQVVDMQQNEAISYRFVLDEAKKRGDRKAIRQLEKIGPPPYDAFRELYIQRKWLLKFGGAFHNEDSYKKYAKIALKQGKEYTPADWVKFLLSNILVAKEMWDELMKINFFEQAPRIEIPVYFLVGRHDYNTPFELVEQYYEMLDAPMGKRLIWFENSAHSPNLEEPEKFADVMINKVLAESYK